MIVKWISISAKLIKFTKTKIYANTHAVTHIFSYLTYRNKCIQVCCQKQTGVDKNVEKA